MAKKKGWGDKLEERGKPKTPPRKTGDKAIVKTPPKKPPKKSS